MFTLGSSLKFDKLPLHSGAYVLSMFITFTNLSFDILIKRVLIEKMSTKFECSKKLLTIFLDQNIKVHSSTSNE